MNKQQVNALIGTVNNLINNGKKFTLIVSPMMNSRSSRILNQTLGHTTNFEIDSISENMGFLKISCFIMDSRDNSQETIFNFDIETVYVQLHTWEEFGNFNSNCTEEEDFNNFIKEHTVNE